MVAHLKLREAGNLSQKIYCMQAEFSYSTFVYWRVRSLRESGQIKRHQFISVKVKQQTDESQSIKIKLISDSIISIPTNVGIAEIANFIHLQEVPNA